MRQTKIVNIFYASAEELQLGINEIDTEITTALQNGNIVPNDPYNVMGYDANGTMLVYRQWVAMRESPHVEPPAS